MTAIIRPRADAPCPGGTLNFPAASPVDQHHRQRLFNAWPAKGCVVSKPSAPDQRVDNFEFRNLHTIRGFASPLASASTALALALLLALAGGGGAHRRRGR